jgi:hypothetical protein
MVVTFFKRWYVSDKNMSPVARPTEKVNATTKNNDTFCSICLKLLENELFPVVSVTKTA